MKNHAIIPIFISHKGCNNDCVFCNQKIITARQDPVTPSQVENIILTHLSTLENRNLSTIEVAFYGGSFTGIDTDEQISYLSVAKKFKDEGSIDKIHLSTRPDYIDENILRMLKNFGVDIIELGVQSFDDDVLRLSKRGHDVNSVYRAVDLIKSFGFSFGIQLMIGLMGDTAEKSIKSASIAASLKPSIARLYPTVVLPDTELFALYKTGDYLPLCEAEAVFICKEMYKILSNAGVNIIRVGLKSTDLINEDALSSNNYHPAFRQLVESEIAKEEVLSKLSAMNLKNIDAIILKAHSKSISNLSGHNGRNRKYFQNIFKGVNIKYISDNSIPIGTYEVLSVDS